MSKIVLPGENAAASAITWRQVQAGAPERNTSPDADRALQAQLDQMQAQAELRAREAHAAGRREGEDIGRAQATAELQPVMERLARSIDEMGRLRARLRQEAESDLVKLALAIAKRVLRREMAIDPEALHGLILAALEKLQGQEISRVKVHPSQSSIMQACLQKSVTGAAIAVLADPACEPGTAIFETKHGNLDASVDSQLQEIERGLADCLRKHS